MNWLNRVSQIPMSVAPQVTLTTDQMMQHINGVLTNQGADLNYVVQVFNTVAPLPVEVCNTINQVAGVNAAARPKMQKLAEAGGCYWNPENPPMDQQQSQQQLGPAPMPPMGQQEDPGDMPAVDIV